MANVPPIVRRLAMAAGAALAREAVRRVRGAKAGKARTAAVPAPPASAPTQRGPRHGADARREVQPTATARLEVQYAPSRDGDADPGEIVWTWVPYEDDPSQGKDRPVLVIGRHGEDVAALALTSKHNDDRHHHALGAWSDDGRPSWVKLDRVLRLDPDGIRREGAVLDEPRFRSTIAAWERY